MGLLSLLIFIPVLALLVSLLLPSSNKIHFKCIALASSIAQVVITIFLICRYCGCSSEYKFTQQLEWIKLDFGSLGSLAIDYNLGMDGINVYLLVLSAFILLAGVVSSWKITENVKGYFSLYLLLSASI